MGQPNKILVIEVHLLGHTLLVSKLVTIITRYLYPWIFICHGYGSFTNPYFIKFHLLVRTLSVSKLVTSITGYLYPWIFVHHGYGLTTKNHSLHWPCIFNKSFLGGNYMQWGQFLLKEGGMTRMENDIHPWYSSTHGIYPWYCKWHLPMFFVHPWNLSTHGIYPWWHL